MHESREICRIKEAELQRPFPFSEPAASELDERCPDVYTQCLSRAVLRHPQITPAHSETCVHTHLLGSVSEHVLSDVRPEFLEHIRDSIIANGNCPPD
jgi:hypothetical protein